jgi:hypothetical protein
MNLEQIASQFYNVTPIQKSSELVFALSTHCARFTCCSIPCSSGKKKPQLTLRLLFCWLPDQDSNLDKLHQKQLCYRYTIRQSSSHS